MRKQEKKQKYVRGLPPLGCLAARKSNRNNVVYRMQTVLDHFEGAFPFGKQSGGKLRTYCGLFSFGIMIFIPFYLRGIWHRDRPFVEEDL
ncbi:hypothetical protein KDH_48370 [Dictyobacter sp. S3.2.2.5]|uniref:Uncharacterized protein n=1 Tax=Dictyobacter halimunensis TaxID=3026934 RepID=A0ABQ6FZM2_9CHLR|nr:hypothetical protein KDH_48370 [Dictyobacter sp. S3.2.2.5]